MALPTGDIKKIKLTPGPNQPLPRQGTSIIHPPEKIRLYIIIVLKKIQTEKYIEASQQDMPS